MSNPLSEATADSIDELFAKDPNLLTRQDRDRIVERLRALRVQWAKTEGEKTTKTRNKKDGVELSEDDFL